MACVYGVRKPFPLHISSIKHVLYNSLLFTLLVNNVIDMEAHAVPEGNKILSLFHQDVELKQKKLHGEINGRLAGVSRGSVEVSRGQWGSLVVSGVQ